MTNNVDPYQMPHSAASHNICPLKFQQLLELLPLDMSKNTGWLTDCVDPDQMPHSVASDLGLHCFLRPVHPNT